MTPSQIKDKILELAYKHPNGIGSEWITKQLNIPHHTAYTLCMEIVDKDKRFSLQDRYWINNDKDLACRVEINQAGKHFYDTSGYEKEEKKAKGDWTKRNPVLWEIGKVIIGLTLGYFIRVATEPKGSQKVHKENTVNTTDSSSKNK